MMAIQAREPNGEIVTEALRVANISGDRLARTGSGLRPAEIAFYRTILRAFPQWGGAPNRDALSTAARDLGLDPQVALTRLHERDLIRLDPTNGTIVTAYPFSGQPTAHRVAVAGAQPVYAMCAIDALGIPFMLNADAQITSRDPVSGAPITVAGQAGQAAWSPAGAVVFIGKSCQEGPSAQVCCSVINFFASRATAKAYQREHPDVQGRIVEIPEALEAGRQVFGNLLISEEPACRDSSCCS
jgi:hypothetical protein